MTPAQKRVFDLFKAHGDLTDEEIVNYLGRPNTHRPRRIELVQRSALIDTGTKRLTRSGKRATVWAINPNYHSGAHTHG